MGGLEKCCGIWICRDDVLKKERYSISFYEIANTKNIGIGTVVKEKLWKEAEHMTGLGQSILEEGIEQGIEQGIEKGIEKGIVQRNEELIMKKHSKGLSRENIAEFLEITVEEVNDVILKKTLNL